MDRAASTAVPTVKIDPRLVSQGEKSGNSAHMASKDPRPSRVLPDHQGNGSVAAAVAAAAAPTATLAVNSSTGTGAVDGDKAKREEGFEVADPLPHDHKPTTNPYQVAAAEGNAVGEQRTAPNLAGQATYAQASTPSSTPAPIKSDLHQQQHLHQQTPPTQSNSAGILSGMTGAGAQALTNTAQPQSAQSQSGGSKIFVGGLSWETDESSLRQYFEAYGEVLDCVIMRDRHTGHPRGFGFVTFAKDEVAERAASRRHDLDGRQVEAKRAVPRNEFGTGAPGGGNAGGMGNQSQSGIAASYMRGAGGAAGADPRFGYGAGAQVPTGAAAAAVPGGGSGRSHHTTRGKVFVGGLPSQCGNEEFKSYFQNFGEVVDAQVMIDHNTGNSRGFGFVTFANEATVETVVGPGRSNTRHEIMGKTVEVKRAEPKGVSDRRRHENYVSNAVRAGPGGAVGAAAGGANDVHGAHAAGPGGNASNAANAAAAAAYHHYGNYTSASLAEQYGAYYNNPQWQQYYAAMGYNFSAYPQSYNPYTYLQAYINHQANGAPQVNSDQAAAAAQAQNQQGEYDPQAAQRAQRYSADREHSSNGAINQNSQNAAAAAARRSSRRDERYHPYR